MFLHCGFGSEVWPPNKNKVPLHTLKSLPEPDLQGCFCFAVPKVAQPHWILTSNHLRQS